jgi:hypothetical protein
MCLLRDLPPAPRPEDYLRWPGSVVADADASRQNRLYVSVDECEQRWQDGEGIDHHDVSVPASWHLDWDMWYRSRGCLSEVQVDGGGMPPHLQPPESVRFEKKYQNEQFW